MQGGEQALEHPAPVTTSEPGFEQALGMRHHAENAPAPITDAGNVVLRPIGIGGRGEVTRRICVTKDDTAIGLERSQGVGVGEIVAIAMRHRNADHLAAMATMALEMHESVRKLNSEFGGISLRIGLHVGSVIAGVIGVRKFIYDVWGDTVNTASRLESHGAPGRTHVSETVFERLQGRFAFEARGTIELKGRGPMNTYFLDAPIP